MQTIDFKPRFLKPTETSSYLDRRESSLVEATDFVYNRFNSQTLQVQRQKLPIFNNRRDILYLLEKHQVLVLVGETGCGKSTQIPQYLIEAEWPAQIGVCEPRKVAAISLANRVADEMGTFVQGDTVGYAVRFDACTNQPKIKYMTEGILLREIMGDPLLKNYSVIMLDEVHERTLYTDILLGLMKKILKKRRELRLVVASATVDAEELQKFFDSGSDQKKKHNSAILSIRGRQYAVDILYLKEPAPCYVQSTVDTVLKINSSEAPGDILAFLTGQEEVDRAVRILREHASILEQEKKKNKIEILPMYGALPHYEQLKVFRHVSDGYRKVIIATNVAETSVTIPGIVYVIDCGFVKLKWFNNETHTDSLVVMPVSKASANQRAGRAGRVKHGKCYRLYTEDEFAKLADSTPPEMVRSNLTYVVLQLKALGISNILQFDFPSPPPVKNLKSAVEILYALNTIDIKGELINPLGFNMAEFAIDPLYSKILFSSGDFGCSEEILTIISMLQVESVFTKPSTGNMIAKSRIQRRNFEVAEGDLITYLNIYSAFVKSEMDKGFCHKNFINYKAMKRVADVRSNLQKMALNYNIPLISCQVN
ncbi:probable ATP-dependent RNA helicase DHX35 isoform X2 [Agrilus planipennis]|uniref:Probable ATP-dependent RNA helicase DHX35 isoform X2 n=1 Tax=Agrilus planipennis TaxID=224129 RepID=A0A7F5RLP5_AGRPL|nr:probable ATP-dependent RNA helicase DHX35 isoform X2 [Agrilus planipennis]